MESIPLQPFRRIELIIPIAISVLPGTHFHLSQVKHLRVKCLTQGHNILTMSKDWEGRNMIFLWKFCTKRDSKPHDRHAKLNVYLCVTVLYGNVMATQIGLDIDWDMRYFPNTMNKCEIYTDDVTECLIRHYMYVSTLANKHTLLYYLGHNDPYEIHTNEKVARNCH